MAYTKDRYTSDDYFEYVMSLKYSEAIEMLTCIGKEHKLNINTASGFIKGMKMIISKPIEMVIIQNGF